MCNSDNNQPMAIQLAPLVGAGLGALQQSKLIKASEGTKTYTKPQTIFGKLIGGISGRTAAAEASDMYKSQPVSEKVMNSLVPRTAISGGLSVGGEATKKTYLPFYIVGAIVVIFYFMRKGGRRRR